MAETQGGRPTRAIAAPTAEVKRWIKGHAACAREELELELGWNRAEWAARAIDGGGSAGGSNSQKLRRLGQEEGV